MKSGYNNSYALLLNTTDFGESDKIITFFTSEHGKLKGIAKGARRSRKRFVNKLEPFILINLSFFYKPGREMVRVEGCKTIKDFPRIKKDLDLISYGSYMLELIAKVTRDWECNRKLFNLLLHFIDLLDKGKHPEKLLLFYEARLLSSIGYQPHLSSCLECGEETEKGYFFSSTRGGIVCSSCTSPLDQSMIPVSNGTLKFLNSILELDIKRLQRLIPGQTAMEEISSVLRDFVCFQIGSELKSRKFIEHLKYVG